MKKTQFFKKAVALTAAGLLAIGPVQGVLAAEGFSEVISGQVDDQAANLTTQYNTYMDSLEQAAKGAVADWTVSLGETGKMLAGMFLPATSGAQIDLNWFNDLKIHQEQAITEDQMTANFQFSLNDTPFANLNSAMDIPSMKMYMAVPELFSDYVVVDMNKAMEETAQDTSGITVSTNVDPAFWSTFIKIFVNAKEYLPDGETFSAVINRYMHMFFDRFQDTGSAEQTITAGGIAQDFTVYTGEISNADAIAAVIDILTAAKDDEDIKGIIENISTTLPEGTDLYTQFQSGIDSALADMNPDEADGSVMTAALSVDAEGEVKGTAVSIDGAPIVDFQQTADGDSRGLYCKMFTDNAEVLSLEGAGEVQDDLLNGTYAVSITSDGEPMNLDVIVENYKYDENTFAGQGTYTISMAAPAEDSESDSGMASMFSQFGIQYGFETAENAQGGKFDLAVVMAGSPVLSIAMETQAGEGPAAVDISGLKAYDITNDADMQSFMATLDIGGFLNNLVNAGVPEELINSVLGIEGSDTAEETPAA